MIDYAFVLLSLSYSRCSRKDPRRAGKMKVAADRRSQHDECPSTSVGECVAIICRRIKREVKRQLGLTNAYSHTMYIPQRQCQIVDCSLPKTSG